MDVQLKSGTWKEYSTHRRKSAHLIGWQVKKLLEEYEIICDGLAKWESFFPGKSSLKYLFLRFHEIRYLMPITKTGEWDKTFLQELKIL